MKTQWLALALFATVLTSCQSSEKNSELISREPQQVAEDSHDNEAQFENTFKSLMAAEGSTEQIKEENRTKEIGKLVERQVNVFYTAQEMVQNFDATLNKLYEEKMKNPSQPVDLTALETERRNLNITWEFNEKNLHEMQYIYYRMLSEFNSPKSEYQKAAGSALKGLDQHMSKLWNKGDRWAALAVSQDLDIVGMNFQKMVPQARLPEFRRFANITGTERMNIIQQGMRNFKSNRQLRWDNQFQSQWEKFKFNRQTNEMKLLKERSPQAKQIYPDGGKTGNINGSYFPAGVWSITMDDGPHPVHTKGMIKAISNVGMKGHFFWLSRQMELYPDLVKAAGDAGFKRSSHSYTHANLPKLGEVGLKKEIDDATDTFEKIVGERPTFFRCPYGACNGNGSRIRQKIANQKMIHAFWNVDSLDWQDKNAYSIYERVKKQMEINGRGIVLFHDIHPQSVEAMKLVVGYIKSKPEWKVYTLDEIMKMETGTNYPSP